MNYLIVIFIAISLYLVCCSLDAMDYVAEIKRSASNFETKKHERLYLEGMHASEIEEENNRC